MSIGAVIRIVECIVTIFCGVRLAVRPCEMRWDHKAAKVIFGVLVAAGMAYESINTFWFKFSAIITLQLAIYFFIVLLIFYRIYFLKLLAQNFLYWFSIMLLRYFIVCACAMLTSENVLVYIYAAYGRRWHWLQIVSMLATMGVVLWILYAKRGKALIRCRFKRDYILFSIPVLIEVLLEQILFGRENFTSVVERDYLFFCALVFWGLASLLLLFLIYNNYKEKSYHERMSNMNLDTLQKQYGLLHELYTEKRRQVHDAAYHDILLIRYLKEGQTDKALEYLEEKQDKSFAAKKSSYSGIPVIDMMLDYKLGRAGKYDINVDLDIDAYFCPVDDTEMSVILGNLLDNAIEAVRELPEEQRRIQVSMRTPNDFFLLQIKNSYVGKRRKIEGHYMTTKEDKEMHGLGLGSVERLVKKYNGSLKITDDGHEFTVVVTVYKIPGQKIEV